MPSNRSISDLTRQELYNLIWSQPATKVAEEFGVSDVAIAKRCRKWNIPLPSRGYWAKIAAGQQPMRPSLPPSPTVVFVQAARQSLGKTLTLPDSSEELHPLAATLMRALNAAKPDSQKRASICEREIPRTIVTKALAERVAKAFHAMLQVTEPLGIPFRKARSCYDPGYFERGNDRLYFKIEEELVVTSGSNRDHWTWQTNDYRIPSGHLIFILNPERYGDREAKRWVESKRLPLEKLLAQLVRYIRQHYVQVQRRRAQEAIEQKKQQIEAEKRWREYQEKEAIRLAEEQKRKHAKALKAVTERRQKNLLRAAEWWRLDQVAQEFIAACERRWRNEQGEQLNPGQEEWLKWARETSSVLSPFSMGYPEPANDGPFNPSAVPFGGPFPQQRKIPSPPTMLVIPPPLTEPAYRRFL